MKAEVEQTLKDVDLYSKKDTRASDLSGILSVLGLVNTRHVSYWQ